MNETITTLEAIQTQAKDQATHARTLITTINSLPPDALETFTDRFIERTSLPLSGIPTLLQNVEYSALSTLEDFSSRFRAEPPTHSQLLQFPTEDLIKTVVERTIAALNGWSIDEDLPPSAASEIADSLLSTR